MQQNKTINTNDQISVNYQIHGYLSSDITYKINQYNWVINFKVSWERISLN